MRTIELKNKRRKKLTGDSGRSLSLTEDFLRCMIGQTKDRIIERFGRTYDPMASGNRASRPPPCGALRMAVILISGSVALRGTLGR